ncbi:MAG: alkaline phosphatase family protein [Burkholderiaceae bacterium]
MSTDRVIMLELDGFEFSIAEAMVAEGRLPNFARLMQEAASLRLDHGRARHTGLAGEHVSTGSSPEHARRWSAVDFDPGSYRVLQWPTRAMPFAAELPVRSVVFDRPYFDLSRATRVRGAVAWGAHDPGVAAFSRPSSLNAEIERRFGPYPAAEWLYGFVWPSATRAKAMADALADAVSRRAEVVVWLLAERLPDWDLALVSVSEFHTALEAMWHGIDAAHPLHGMASAAAARRGLEATYQTCDRMIGRLRARFDARLVVFSMHGMGPNVADPACMLALPELLYRDHFGEPLFRNPSLATSPEGVPLLDESDAWAQRMSQCYPPLRPTPAPSRRSRLARLKGSLRRWMRVPPPVGAHARVPAWMPAYRYRPYWSQMRAFAIPAYYDGRIRLNLVGRESHGLVAPEDYASELTRIEALLHACRDPLSGASVVASIERCAGADPTTLAPSAVDLVVEWRPGTLGLQHPTLGRIGPLPMRRTGGHTGGDGVAWFVDPALGAGDHGRASAFDVVPTVIEMLGQHPLAGISGRSCHARLRAPARPPAWQAVRWPASFVVEAGRARASAAPGSQPSGDRHWRAE